MDDPIIPVDDNAPPPVPPEPAEAVATPDEGGRMDRLEAAMAELVSTVTQVGTQLVNGQQAGPPAPPQSNDEFLNELATDPQGVIARVAKQTFQDTADQTLNPAVLQVLDTASKQLLDGHAQRVDAEFGYGTFEEVFKPQLDKDIAQLRGANPRAMADPGTVEALVNRLYGGENFGMLVERRGAAEKAGHVGGAGSHVMPGGGIPRLRAAGSIGDEIPADVETFLREVERSTGEHIDRKEYAKVYHTGVETGPGRHRTTVVDYLKAVGADPDTLKMYAGERGAR